MLPYRREDHIACRTCGADITDHARYNRGWTQCPVCYWKSQLDRQKPLGEILSRRIEVRNRLEALPAEIKQMESTIERYTAEREAKFSWWRRFLGVPRDDVLDSYWGRLVALRGDLQNLERELSHFEGELAHAKHVKKKFLEAQIADRAASVRKRQLLKDHEKFCADALANLEREFDRSQFYIQTRDYKRGNKIDNYFRNEIPDVVMAAFGHSCVICGARDNITFDHYGLPKNEGGNFALILADRSSFRLNIVVLCRGCNAMKGERAHSFYLSDAQLEQANAYQKVLLERLLQEERFFALIKKWGLIRLHSSQPAT